MVKTNYDFWRDVWEKKGRSKSNDLEYLDGYDCLNISVSSNKICDCIVKEVGIQKTDMVLEVGCGAGFLARDMKYKCVYQGVDYCRALADISRIWHRVPAFQCEANDLFYPNKSMDIVFCYGLFQYLPDKDYVVQVLNEMFRVARRGIFIGDIKKESDNDKHQVFMEEYFVGVGMTISACFYNPVDITRFNACIKLKENNE